MTGRLVRDAYSRAEVLRMLELPQRRLAGWEKQGLAPRLEQYAFTDVVVLRSLIRLREGGASPSKIRRALAALRRKFAAIQDPLKELRVFCESGRIAVEVGGAAMEAVSGQLLLDFDPAERPRMLSFPRQAAHDALKAAEAARRFESSVWFEKALELESAGAELAEVIRAYENVLELDPVSTGALVNLGTVHFHLKNWDQAEDCYRRALEADPNYPLAHFNLGNLFDERGDSARALLHYVTALRLDPSYADAHYNLALVYQSTGQALRALRHWKAYLRLDPASTWASIARQELEKLRRATVIEGAKRAEAAT